MEEFKEVYSKKKGKTYVFCNLEELVKKAFGVDSIEQARPHLQPSSEEYIIRCPLCAHEHTKHKLYIKEDLSVGHCFLCGREYINVTDNIDTAYTIPSFSEFLGRQKFEVVPLTDPTWSLDRFKYEFDDFDQRGYDYLIGRHGFMKDLYKVLGFKFWEGNVAMPFFYHGEIIYYQIRFSSADSSIRYFFPPIKSPTGLGAKPPYIIDHEVPENRIILCEGVFDAIACLIMAPDYIPIAVLGSTISDYQLEFVREYLPKEIKIYLDKTELSVNLAKRVRTAIDYCPINIIKSDGQDPEEKMKELLKWGRDLQWIKPYKPKV